MNLLELKKTIESYSDNFKLKISVDDAQFLTCQDFLHTEVICANFYCEWMAESESITIRWEDFREFLDSRGIEIDRELYEYLYAGVENKHVEEMLNDWLKLQ
jgi:hypothetical protein